jgi:HSF-type DNA-binding
MDNFDPNSCFFVEDLPFLLPEDNTLSSQDERDTEHNPLVPLYQDHQEPSSTVAAMATATATAAQQTPDENSPDGDIVDDISFPVKLYMMLENAPLRGYQDIISWVDDGKAFKVHDHGRFVTTVMPLYFNQSKYESFRRQLNLYRFHRVAKGKDRGVVSHPFLMAGSKSKCRYIQRCHQASSRTAASSLTA